MKIYCCGCKKDVEARLTTGTEIYPHRQDLNGIVFFRCDVCNNYVGTHRKLNKDGTRMPLGSIPTPELRKVRSEIHELMDPIWRNQKMQRSELYAKLSFRLGIDDFHTGSINNMMVANLVIKEINKIKEML